MPKILDSVFLEQMVKEKKEQHRSNSIKNWLSSWSDLGSLTKFCLLTILGSALLITQLAGTSFLGIPTLLGSYQDVVQKVSHLEQQIETHQSSIAGLQKSQQQLSERTLPAALQELHAKREMENVDFDQMTSRIYRLLDEVVPQNIVRKTVVISMLQWDADNNRVLLQGTVNNEEMSMFDGKMIGSGYSLLSYFVLNANRSPYFMGGAVGEVAQPENETKRLSFQIDLPLQTGTGVDPEDNEETFLDYLQSQVDSQKIKR